jgi:hypothetical protein
MHLGAESAVSSENPLKSLRIRVDFDSTMRRFESSRPSQDFVFETSRFQRSGFEGGARLQCFANFREPFLIPSCCSGHAPSRFRTRRDAQAPPTRNSIPQCLSDGLHAAWASNSCTRPNSKIILLVRPFLPCHKKICRTEAPQRRQGTWNQQAMVGFAGRSGRRTAGVALP